MASLSLIKLGTRERYKSYNRGWRSFDLQGRTQIAKIFVCHDDLKITSLQFQFVENNTNVSSDIYGQTYGFKFDIVSINYPVEYITWIGGTCSQDSTQIYTLSIGTNKQTCGPFGGTPSNKQTCSPFGGTPSDPFGVPKQYRYNFGPDNHFYGFHGLFDSDSIVSIGVFVNPIPIQIPIKKETH